MKDIYVVTCHQASAHHFYIARAFASEERARHYANIQKYEARRAQPSAVNPPWYRVEAVTFDDSEPA